MGNSSTRYDLHWDDRSPHMEVDLILNTENRKTLFGTVWNDDTSEPKRVTDAAVVIYESGRNYNDDPNDIKPIGWAFTDHNGEFFAGPFDQNTKIILKIFKNNLCRSSDEYSEDSCSSSNLNSGSDINSGDDVNSGDDTNSGGSC